MGEPIYRRVIVKLSGEALLGPDGTSIHQPIVDRIAADLVAARSLGTTLGIVIGGGNICRGGQIAGHGLPRTTGDAMGMLATVINALALEAAIEKAGAPARTLSALIMPAVCETFSRQQAQKHLAKGRIVLLAAGTGNPYFTTDTAAVLRASELQCEAVLKATNVDGIYSADPKKDPKAHRFDCLTHQDALDRDLKVMDATAFALARENRMPIMVFSIHDPGAVTQVLAGKGHSTIVGKRHS